MQWFLWDEFDIWMSEYTISRWLRREDIRKKRTRFIAAERNQYLRDDWIRRLAQWKHYQMSFIDESATNERTKNLFLEHLRNKVMPHCHSYAL